MKSQNHNTSFLETDSFKDGMSSIKYYPFSNDFMFAQIMQNCINIAKELLEILMDKPIERIEYIDTQHTGNYDLCLKAVRFDVYIKDSQNTHYYIEMQVGDYKDLPKRMRFYPSVSDTELLKTGQSYRELPELYIIFICTGDPFGMNQGLYTIRNWCMECDDLLYNDGANKLVFNALGSYERLSVRQKKFLKYITTGETQDDILLNNIDEKVKEINEDPGWRKQIMTLEEKIRDLNYYAREEGIKEGIAKKEFQLFSNAFHRLIDSGLDSDKALETIALFHGLEKEYISDVIFNNKKRKHVINKFY